MPFGPFKRLWPASAAPTITDAEWSSTLQRLPFLLRLDIDELAKLRALSEEFIAKKSFSGAAGFPLTDEIVVAIAAQACLPVLHLGLDKFDAFSEIIVYPGEFHVQREFVDDDGVVHDVSGPLSGEAMPGGPVVISWDDVELGTDDLVDEADRPAYNVVIHEFAHKLDMAYGSHADGCPPFDARLHAGLEPRRWRDVLDDAYAEFCDMVDALEDDFPAHIDPESDEGLMIYESLPLDAYAADDPAEFFAVASESYFVAPDRLAENFPALYDMLDRYYRPRPLTAAPR